jgi:hypothetical protein
MAVRPRPGTYEHLLNGDDAVKRPRPTAADVDLVEPGYVIAEGTIAGRAIPWKAPAIGKNGGVIMGGPRGRVEGRDIR